MNKKIYFVTTNKRKVETYSARLKAMGWTVEAIESDIAESRDFDVLSVTDKKLSAAAHLTKLRPLMVEDRGLSISCLNNFPGSHVKIATEMMGLQKLMDIIDPSDSRVKFEYVIGWLDAQGSKRFFSGYETGSMIKRNPAEVANLHDIFCSDGVPGVPLSALSSSQQAVYEGFWTRTDALTKMMEYLNKHE